MSSITWADTAGVLQAIEPDVMLSEHHASEADVTDDPVESGANTTDNVRRKSRVLNLELFVADQFKGPTYSASGGKTFDVEIGRSARVFTQLEKLLSDGTRTTVSLGGVGGFGRSYPSMVVQAARITRTSKEKDSLTISLVMKEIRVVNSEIVTEQFAKEAKGKKKILSGDTGTKPVVDDQYKSNLFKLFIE